MIEIEQLEITIESSFEIISNVSIDRWFDEEISRFVKFRENLKDAKMKRVQFVRRRKRVDASRLVV